MALMDFLFGSPSGTENQLDPNVKALRDSLLARLQMQYESPINMPMYAAVSPDYRYTGANQLLSSLGLDQVFAPDLPTTEINGMTVYDTGPLAEQIEARFMEANPGFKTPAQRNAERAAAAARGGAYTYNAGGDENPEYTTLREQIRSQDPSRYVFADADLYGNHGGNYASKIASDVGKFASGGGIIGAIANAFSSSKDDDPSRGNVP